MWRGQNETVGEGRSGAVLGNRMQNYEKYGEGEEQEAD